MLGRRLVTTDGCHVRLLSPGVWNENAGPDFFNAKIAIEDQTWVGNVEIHVKASDWYRHNHDKDASYDSVMLHIVAIDDARINRSDGSHIPQVCVNFPQEFYYIYSALSNNISDIRCAPYIPSLSPLQIEDWLSSLAVERIQEKANRILDIHSKNRGDWQYTCFVTFARALGFGLNSEPFEMLANSINLNFLSRHSDNLFQLEALLFGQAGMLDMNYHIFDEYYQGLCREYYFLARKYSLRPLRNSVWKYSRTRPGNFPHRRIAMLAQYLYGGFSLMGDILATSGDEEKCRELFVMDLEGSYWETHSGFGSEETRASVSLSDNSVDLLLINLIAPLLYAYSASNGDYERAEQAMSLWENLDAEKNKYIRQWKGYGICCEDALHSQALLQLRKAYCDRDKCLDCRFAHGVLRKAVLKWQ